MYRNQEIITICALFNWEGKIIREIHGLVLQVVPGRKAYRAKQPKPSVLQDSSAAARRCIPKHGSHLLIVTVDTTLDAAMTMHYYKALHSIRHEISHEGSIFYMMMNGKNKKSSNTTSFPLKLRRLVVNGRSSTLTCITGLPAPRCLETSEVFREQMRHGQGRRQQVPVVDFRCFFGKFFVHVLKFVFGK